MNSDLYLVIGITLVILAIPSMFSAFVDGRAPRAAAIILLIGGGLMVTGFSMKPGGYEVQDIPNAFFRVIGRFF
ncbi:hypothetical protein [Gemmobacter denitrificans]|uniref:50S ribosomal protein L35 n=1 Tax=Gemmobacter denitrificans TaxID=3123040 RepID=A0ABU8BXZ9_9RHOB